VREIENIVVKLQFF